MSTERARKCVAGAMWGIKLHFAFGSHHESTHLDPGEKHSHGDHVVELCLPEAERFKVCILIVVCQERLQQVAHFDCSVDVEDNCYVSKEDHNYIQHVPETLEVLQFVFRDLKDFFYGVVYDEKDEDSLAGHHKVIEIGDVTNQLHCAEVEWWDHTSCGWELQYQSGRGERGKNLLLVWVIK